MGYKKNQIDDFAFWYAATETDAVDFTSTMPVVPGTTPGSIEPQINLPAGWRQVNDEHPLHGWVAEKPDGNRVIVDRDGNEMGPYESETVDD